MTAGGSAAARRAGAALLSVALAAWTPAHPASSGPHWNVEQLMQALGEVKSSKARFVERRHFAILTTPLESTGTLLYIAPSRLEKHTLTPRAESLVLAGEELTVEDRERNQRRTLALRDYPLIRAYVESVRSTLAGDLPTLARFYEVGLDGGERRWRLTLRPTEPEMRDAVSEIRISGDRASIDTIEIIEAGGDRSVMTITRDGQ
jgi:outer membrane lipoprotein-sorting protein